MHSVHLSGQAGQVAVKKEEETVRRESKKGRKREGESGKERAGEGQGKGLIKIVLETTNIHRRKRKKLRKNLKQRNKGGKKSVKDR